MAKKKAEEKFTVSAAQSPRSNTGGSSPASEHFLSPSRRNSSFRSGWTNTEDLKSFEVPVYFFQEKADPKATSTAPKLNGGVSAGWRSDDGFQVYVFIGTTFRLFALD